MAGRGHANTIKCVTNITCVMADRSVTVSEEAYRALQRIKEGKESFTDAILRLARKDSARKLVNVLERLDPDENLAVSIERAYGRRGRVRPREARL